MHKVTNIASWMWCIPTPWNYSLLQAEHNHEFHNLHFQGNTDKRKRNYNIYHHSWWLLFTPAHLLGLWRWPEGDCSNFWSIIMGSIAISILFPGHCLSHSKYLQNVWICVLISLNQIFIISVLMGLVGDLINLQVAQWLNTGSCLADGIISLLHIFLVPPTWNYSRDAQPEPSLTLVRHNIKI